MRASILSLLVFVSLAGSALSQSVDATLFAADTVRVKAATSSDNWTPVYEQNPGAGSASNPLNLVGNSGPENSRRTGNLLFGFELPTLTDAPGSGTFSFTRTGTNGTWSWGVTLYAFAPGINPRTLGNADPNSVFYMGAADPSTDVILIQSQVITFSSPADGDRVHVNLTPLFQGSGPLAAFYNSDGTPATTNIWFRLSPDATVSGTSRVRVENVIGSADEPTLSIAPIPEPATISFIAGLLALLGVVLVRSSRRVRDL